MKTIRKQVTRWQDGVRRRVSDELAVEEPLEIRIDSRPVVVTMRTPGHDDELAAGWLYTEGVIQSGADLLAMRPNVRNRAGNSFDVFLSPQAEADLSGLARRGFANSSCGVCGKESIRAVHRRIKPLSARWKVHAALLAELPDRLRAAQAAFDRTGGLHAAGLFTRTGELLVAREDIGRHNAVDKVIGHGLLAGWLPLDRHILMVSGRASFEIMQKALAARLSVVCAVSAPSSMAVDFARASGQTLAGFLRARRMNIYAGVSHVVCAPT